MALSSNLDALKVQNMDNFLKQKAALKMPEWPSYCNFRKVTQNPHFLKKCKGGTKGNFSKIAQKAALVLKAQMHWRKCHYPLISMHLKCKDWKGFWGKKAAPKVPEWPSDCNFCKVTQNPHFLKKCKRGTKGNG